MIIDFLFCNLFQNMNRITRGYLTAGVTGKCGIWREKLPIAESALGAESPKVWAKPTLVRLHAVLAGFLLSILTLLLSIARIFINFRL
jgi:hypothetical protein